MEEEPDAAGERSRIGSGRWRQQTLVSAGRKALSMLQVKNPESLRIGFKLREPHRGGILVEI
jgi:hypothetical protein